MSCHAYGFNPAWRPNGGVGGQALRLVRISCALNACDMGLLKSRSRDKSTVVGPGFVWTTNLSLSQQSLRVTACVLNN